MRGALFLELRLLLELPLSSPGRRKRPRLLGSAITFCINYIRSSDKQPITMTYFFIGMTLVLTCEVPILLKDSRRKLDREVSDAMFMRKGHRR